MLGAKKIAKLTPNRSNFLSRRSSDMLIMAKMSDVPGRRPSKIMANRLEIYLPLLASVLLSVARLSGCLASKFSSSTTNPSGPHRGVLASSWCNVGLKIIIKIKS